MPSDRGELVVTRGKISRGILPEDGRGREDNTCASFGYFFEQVNSSLLHNPPTPWFHDS